VQRAAARCGDLAALALRSLLTEGPACCDGLAGPAPRRLGTDLLC
jgi:hypothetical protein